MNDEYQSAGQASESVLVGAILGISIGLCGLILATLVFAWIAPITVKQSKPRVYVVQSGFVEVCPK